MACLRKRPAACAAMPSVMTLPLRRFCSTQAVLGMAIQRGRSLTAKRMSVASAWRVAMATTVAFQTQWSCSPVQRSVATKSSYIGLRVDGCAGRGKLWSGGDTPPPTVFCKVFERGNLGPDFRCDGHVSSRYTVRVRVGALFVVYGSGG